MSKTESEARKKAEEAKAKKLQEEIRKESIARNKALVATIKDYNIFDSLKDLLEAEKAFEWSINLHLPYPEFSEKKKCLYVDGKLIPEDEIMEARSKEEKRRQTFRYKALKVFGLDGPDEEAEKTLKKATPIVVSCGNSSLDAPPEETRAAVWVNWGLSKPREDHETETMWGITSIRVSAVSEEGNAIKVGVDSHRNVTINAGQRIEMIDGICVNSDSAGYIFSTEIQASDKNPNFARTFQEALVEAFDKSKWSRHTRFFGGRWKPIHSIHL